jgi:hypothetical protein
MNLRRLTILRGEARRKRDDGVACRQCGSSVSLEEGEWMAHTFQPSLAEAGRLWHSQGLPVRERVRPVRAWPRGHPVRSHCYVAVGQCVVWEVC